MSKILGVEKDAFTDDFIEDHFAEISKAAEGDEEAIESLRSSLQDSIVANVLLDSGFTEEKIAELKNQFNELESRFRDIQLGVALNGDDQLVQDLQKVIDAAGMTEEEANEYLQSIGMTPTYEQQEIDEVKTVPTYEVTPSIKMEEKDFGPLGKHKIPSGISFKVTQGSTEEFTGKTTLGAITTNGTTPKIKTITKTGGSAKYNTYSSINSGSGSPGGSGGSSSSSSEPQTKDLNEDEKDRYEKVNVQLDKISASLSKLQSQEDKLLGQKLIDNLNAQLTELNKKIDKTNEKLKIAQQEQAELQSELSGYGISFDSEGVMTNYAEVFDRQQAALNAVYNHYNSLSADAQEGYESTVEAAEKRWEDFKDAVSDYDTLIGSTIPDLQQDIQDTIDEKLEIQIKEFNMSIDLSLDIKDAQDTWNDFRKQIIKDLEDTDILGNALDSLERFADYYNQQGLGVIQQEIDHLNKLMGEVDKYNTTGWSTVYGDDEQSMMEDLKEYYEQTMSDLESVKDLVDEIHDKMNETLEDIADEMDQQTSYYDAVKDTLEHDMQLVNLVYGEAAYDKLALYYEQLSQNLNSQLEFQKATVDFWRTQMDTLEEGSEE
jgi:hypothetical protein